MISPSTSSSFAHPGRRIGRYRLVRPIGAGGMGSVWEAEQEDPRRTVAIKLLSRLEDPEAALRLRFEAEILAQLSHPGIAQVFETGVEREGEGAAAREQPWFAMEHVAGARTLLEYALEEGLDLAARLRLFLRVAEAVHHGHQKGVIHRDLKPANLLVDREGHPKVIDFGIARLERAEGIQSSLRTSTGQVLGTLRYMSPEQVSAERGGIDLRSDVFALGLVLFELAAGRAAYELEALSLTDAVQAVSRARVPSLRSVARNLPAPLEWIVQRACAPERERRYPSVAQLADDLQRFLAGDTISAAPPDTLYRLGHFVRRHRLAVAAALAVVASLVLALTNQSRSLRLERRYLVAERLERQRAQGNAEFLASMLTFADPAREGHDVRVVDVLDEAAPRIAARFADQPLLRADLHYAVGSTYSSLSRHAQALEHARAAEELRRSRLPAADPDRLRTGLLLGAALYGTGDVAQAEALLAELEPELERVLGGDDPHTVRARCLWLDILVQTGRLDEAREQLEGYIGSLDPRTAPLDERTVHYLDRLMQIALRAHALDDFEAWMERFEARREDLPPALARKVADVLQNRGIALAASGRPAEAAEAFAAGLERAERLFGPAGQTTNAMRTNLANVALMRGDGAEALRWVGEALAAVGAHLGPDHPQMLDLRYARTGALWVSGERERACEELGELIGVARVQRPDDAPGTAEWTGSLGRMHVSLERPAEGLPYLRGSFQVLARERGEAHPTAQQSLRWLVRALDELGLTEEAEALRPSVASSPQ